jgi:hypothetical protein
MLPPPTDESDFAAVGDAAFASPAALNTTNIAPHLRDFASRFM